MLILDLELIALEIARIRPLFGKKSATRDGLIPADYCKCPYSKLYQTLASLLEIISHNILDSKNVFKKGVFCFTTVFVVLRWI